MAFRYSEPSTAVVQVPVAKNRQYLDLVFLFFGAVGSHNRDYTSTQYRHGSGAEDGEVSRIVVGGFSHTDELLAVQPFLRQDHFIR